MRLSQQMVNRLRVKNYRKWCEFDAECRWYLSSSGCYQTPVFEPDSTVELDDIGMVKLDGGLQTTMSGVFAMVMFVPVPPPKIASAVGEGATATFAHARVFGKSCENNQL